MKEASGELNMTVVTILAIAAISFFFMQMLWPTIQKNIENQWGEVEENSRAKNP